MTHRDDLPPYEVVSVEDISHAGAMRLRINVALSPEDSDEVGKVALDVVTRHAGTYEVAMIFFHYSEANVDRQAAAIRAQYVRNDMRERYRPQPITSPLGTIEIETRDRVITVENARNA